MAQHSQQPAIVPPGADLPPPRPGVRHVRVSFLGVIVADDGLRRRVDRFFHWPMIVLALAVLPLLLVEFLFLQERDDRVGSTLWWVCLIATIVIWLAFVVEYLVKIAIAENRLEYARRNWLDAIIIVMPILRPLRVAAIARTTQVFTMRGVGMKCARYIFTLLVGLEATDRMARRMGLKVDRTRLAPDEMTRQQLHEEIRRLRRLVDQWESWHACEVEHLRQRGIELKLDEPPANVCELVHPTTLPAGQSQPAAPASPSP
jgi:voltage-gated potassium channel